MIDNFNEILFNIVVVFVVCACVAAMLHASYILFSNNFGIALIVTYAIYLIWNIKKTNKEI